MQIHRTVTSQDLQAVLLFFGERAAGYFLEYRTVPAAVLLVWMESDKAQIRALHQFPTGVVAGLLRSDQGKAQLAHAIQSLLDPDVVSPGAPPGPRPHMVVQVLLGATQTLTPPADKTAEVAPATAALLLLVHVRSETYVVAVPVDAATGAVGLPAYFDVAAARVKTTILRE